MAVKKLKAFSQYVKEAAHPTLSIELPDGEAITINYPTGAIARSLSEQVEVSDQIKTLFGEEQGTKLLGYYDDAPADVLNAILTDVLEEFGLIAGE